MLIETERLLITEFTMDMAQTVQENSVDEDNKRFVPDEVWETVEEAQETLEFLISQYGSFEGPLVYPILVKDTKTNVGYVQLCPIEDGMWEIGYHIAKKYTGNGYATEAVTAFLPVIAKQAGVSEIYGICLAENKASLAVLQKSGFKNVFTGIGEYQGADREIIKYVWRICGNSNDHYFAHQVRKSEDFIPELDGAASVQIRYVTENEKAFWYTLDKHLPESEFENKVRSKQGYVLFVNRRAMGILRYNLFWDNTPFCTMLYVDPSMQGKGLGSLLMHHWESEMKALGYGMVLTSTRADESAQHFYRKLGYQDCGGLLLNIPGFEQPMELFLGKLLR